MSGAVDVLVVGMGPAGARAAATAAAAGCRVLAVDRRPAPGEPVQCAGFVPRPLAGYVPEGALCQRVHRMETVLPSGRVETTPFEGLMVDRAAFDRGLLECSAAAGAVLRSGTALTGLEPERREARLEGGGGEERVGYRVLVAADGPRSGVRRALGRSRLPALAACQITVALAAPSEATRVWLGPQAPGGYGWLFPRGGIAYLGAGVDRRYGVSPKAAVAALHARLHAAGTVGGEVLARTGGAVPAGGAAELATQDVLFAGDAAGLTHPVSGAGIAAAVASGEAAGRAAAAFVAGEAGAPAAYAEQMHELFGPGLSRAVDRRVEMAPAWAGTGPEADAAARRGWIAFPEHYREEAVCP